MSAAPPNHGVDRDRPVHHRGTGAHDEQFSEAEQHGRGKYVGGHHDRNWASSYQPGSQLSSRERVVGVMASGARERHEFRET
jgi:hypothetical protein